MGCAAKTKMCVQMFGDKTIQTGADLQGCTIESFKLHSPSMNRDIDVVIVFPPAYQQDADKRFAVLHTLHGRSAPYKAWSDMKSLRTALSDQPMIVTCFNGDKAGWYIDATQKPDSQFTTFFLDEFIPFVDATYRTTGKPAQRGVMGFSMGGWGAFHYMLTRPDAFASASSASSAMNYIAKPPKTLVEDLEVLLGKREEHPRDYDRLVLWSRIEAAARNDVQLPHLMMTSGTEDKNIDGGRAFKDHLLANHFPVEYVESPGEHKWAYWNSIAPRLIDFHWRTFQDEYVPKDLAK